MTASPPTFFLLVFVLSIPFYLLGAVGGRLPGLPILPASALMAFMPMLAMLILVYRRRDTGGVVGLLKSASDMRRVPGAVWVMTALLFMPIVCVLEFAVLRLSGSAVPFPQIAPGDALFLFVAFFVGAVGEELGWQGYAYPGLRSRLSAVPAALVLGAIWALWHVIPYVQLGRSPAWIVWHGLSTIALRVIVVWLFENTGKSVLIAVLFHTMINVSWALFPNAGSFYDPLVALVILAVAAGIIVFLWGPATLARFGGHASAASDPTVEDGSA